MAPALALVLGFLHTANATANANASAAADRGERSPPVYVADPSVKHRSLAVRVSDQPLVHTAQVHGDTVSTTLKALDALLRAAGSGNERIIKLNVYVSEPAAAAELDQVLPAAFPVGRLPAVTTVISPLSAAGARVAMDAVATLAAPQPDGKVRKGGGTFAVLPSGPAFYVSGQAKKGSGVGEAVRGTMEELGETLRFLGAEWSDVVQVKVFIEPMEGAAEAVAAIRSALPETRPLPPVVLVEWVGGGLPVEIELIVASRVPGAADPVGYLTPPTMKASPVFSRVARVGGGDRIYISGVRTTGSAAQQVEECFRQLGVALKATESNLRHLVKATYFVAADDVSRALNEHRPRFFDPARPPAASKAMVRTLGSPDSTLVMDMIAVPAPGPK